MRVRDVPKQEAGADDSSKFAKGLIEAVLAAVGSQPAKDRRGADAAGLDGENDAQHVGEMRLYQVPVDVLGEERALYARVSSHDQPTLPLQIKTMREYALRRGWQITTEIKEIGSGALQRAKR
jgi:hypothetical protein